MLCITAISRYRLTCWCIVYGLRYANARAAALRRTAGNVLLDAGGGGAPPGARDDPLESTMDLDAGVAQQDRALDS